MNIIGGSCSRVTRLTGDISGARGHNHNLSKEDPPQVKPATNLSLNSGKKDAKGAGLCTAGHEKVRRWILLPFSLEEHSNLVLTSQDMTSGFTATIRTGSAETSTDALGVPGKDHAAGRRRR